MGYIRGRPRSYTGIDVSKMQTRTLITVLLILCVFMTGCLFTHTVEPLTFNREPTKVRESQKEALGRISHFQYPMTAMFSIRLGKNGLGDIAKEHGIDTIYYADIEKWSAVFGIWRMDTVHVYGR